MVTAMKMTVGALNDLRDKDRFQALFEKAVMLCRKSDVPFPELPRQRRPHKRFCGPAPAHSWTTAEEYFRSQFFQLVGTAVSQSQLKLRYDQPGLNQYMQLENVLIAADTSTDHWKTVTSPYPEMGADRLAQLAVQLQAMMQQQNWQLESVEDIATKLRSAQPVVCSQYVWPGGAASSSPADNILCSNAAEAERSFSSLRTSAKNLPAQLNESAATQSPGCSNFCMFTRGY